MWIGTLMCHEKKEFAMIYLTGQLLFFLLVTAIFGFVLGWTLRGAMLPTSVLNGREMFFQAESRTDQAGFLVQKAGSVSIERGSTNESQR